MEISDYEFQDSSESMFAVIVGAYLVDHPDRNRKLIDFGKEIPEIDGAELALYLMKLLLTIWRRRAANTVAIRNMSGCLKRSQAPFLTGKLSSHL